jgi:GT2 family glycosyltransferase
VNTKPFISVAIATYNRAGLLRQTLEGVTRQAYPKDRYEIIVIDNNSTDSTRQITEDFTDANPAPRYVLERKQGLSCARNRVIAEARGDIIVFADDDILVEPDWLEQLATPFEQNPAHPPAAVGGEVIPVFPNGLPAWIAAWHGPLALRPDTGPLGPRQFPMGANLAIRRDVFAQAGLFNESLGRQAGRLLGGEETEFLRRVRALGLEVWFAPRAKVLHQLPASRTTLNYAARHAFDSARSRVIEKADASLGFHLSRWFINLCKAPLFALFGLFCLLVFRVGNTKQFLVRAYRSCGYLYQIPRTLCGKM